MNIAQLGAGPKPPSEIYAVIEIPKNSNVKYELDKETGILMVDRFVYTAMSYPFNYGFIPASLEEDGDPVDVMVLTDSPIVPGAALIVKPLGLLQMEDEAGVDTKVVAVPKEKLDPVWGKLQDIQDIPEHYRNKIKHFFDHMKELEPGKWVKTKDWLAKEKAEENILRAIERYKQHNFK